MSGHTFLGTANGSSSAVVASWTHPISFMSAQGNWRMRSLGDGLFTIYRNISGTWTEIDGSTVSAADARSLWYLLTTAETDLGGKPYLTPRVSNDLNATTWKISTVAGATTLQRYFSGSYHSISGGTLTRSTALELRDLVDVF